MLRMSSLLRGHEEGDQLLLKRSRFFRDADASQYGL